MTLTHYTNGSNNVYVTYPAFTPVAAGEYNNRGAGGFSGTLTGSGIPGLDGSIDTYCVQLGEYFSFNGAYSDYTVINPASIYFQPSSPVGARADRMAQLFSYVVDSNLFANAVAGTKDDLSTALQLAVWEIKYESELTALDVTIGDLKASTGAGTTNATFTNLANSLLTSSAGATITQELYVLQSLGNPGHQDQVMWRPKSVPEPASLSLAMLAFAAAGMATRRRKPVQG